MIHSDIAQLEALAFAVKAVPDLPGAALTSDLGLSVGEKVVRLLRAEVARTQIALETINRLEIAFEDKSSISENVLVELKETLKIWSDWCTTNTPIVNKIISDLAKDRKSVRGTARYEDAIAVITAAETGLTMSFNASIDVIIYLKTRLHELDPDSRIIVATASNADEIDEFFNRLDPA